MARSAEARRCMVHGRRWSVYEATGIPGKPLRFVTCVRANAKSVAVGIVHRGRNIPKRELVAVDGCPANAHVTLYGAKRRRRRRR